MYPTAHRRTWGQKIVMIGNLHFRRSTPRETAGKSCQAARFETSTLERPRSQIQRATHHSLSHTSQCPSHRKSASISDSVRVSQRGIDGRLARSSHFAMSAFLSIASARNQSSRSDPTGQPLSSHNWYATVAISPSVPRLGMVHFLSEPCGCATQRKRKTLLDSASRFLYKSGGWLTTAKQRTCTPQLKGPKDK